MRIMSLVLVAVAALPLTLEEGQTVSDCGCLLAFYADRDGDAFGDETSILCSDIAPEGYVSDYGDCDDNDATINPLAIEVCDGVDNDCNPETEEPGCQLEVHFINVGQGDSSLIIAPDGTTLLIDAGKESAYSSLAAYLDDLSLDGDGQTSIDQTLVTHMHEDHLGGMDLLLKDHLEVSTCYDHGGDYSSSAYKDYDEVAGDRRATLKVGDTLALGGGLQADILHGDTGSGSENLNSIVLRLSFGGLRLLIGGDCETDGCEDTFDPGPLEVYKVHHHGSSGASSVELLEAMMPLHALISVGENSYGHPHEETLERLETVGATIWRTDMDGSVVVRLHDGRVDVASSAL